MKELFFSIAFNNHTFNIRTTPRTTLCSYSSHDKYTTSLIFASTTFAHVSYKNLLLRSKVTKRNVWEILLDYKPALNDCTARILEFAKQIQGKENTESSDNSSTNFPDNILYLYGELIDNLSEIYSYVDDKEKFRQQLCKYLCNSYEFDDIDTLDKTIEYENWDDVGPDEDPIIEKTTLRNELINECKDFFVAFHQAELDNKNKKSIITLENVISEFPQLNSIPMDFLRKEFDAYLEQNYDDLINVNIYYCKSDELHNIGVTLQQSYQYFVFTKTMHNKIDKIIAAMGVDYIDKDEIYSYFETKYSPEDTPNDKEFKQNVTNIVNERVTFYRTYNKFFNLFSNDYIDIEWDEQTIQLFQKYDQKELPIDSKYIAEYEVYQYVMPLYKEHFFRKNSTKYKPTIAQLPAFISYASSVLDILFKHEILVDNEDCVVYNKNGDIKSAYEEIEKISIP